MQLCVIGPLGPIKHRMRQSLYVLGLVEHGKAVILLEDKHSLGNRCSL